MLALRHHPVWPHVQGTRRILTTGGRVTTARQNGRELITWLRGLGATIEVSTHRRTELEASGLGIGHAVATDGMRAFTLKGFRATQGLRLRPIRGMGLGAVAVRDIHPGDTVCT